MTIMIPANKMKPTAQPLASCARPADRYCGAASSVTADPSSWVLLGQPVVTGGLDALSGNPHSRAGGPASPATGEISGEMASVLGWVSYSADVLVRE
jgi:hypothetical protein